MKIPKISAIALLIITGIAMISLLFVTPAFAAELLPEDVCPAGSTADVCNQSDRTLFGPGSLFDTILQTLIFVVGAVAVLMIVIGGLRYVLSGGDPNTTAAARSTILHAVIGVVVAVSAQLILSFILRRL